MIWLIVTVLMTPSGLVRAQDPDGEARVKPKFSITRADTSLSDELQRALEAKSVSDDLQKIVVLCANSCESKTQNATRVPERLRHKSRKVDFISCTGAAACVQVISREDRCEVGTVKCNAKGCGCKAK